MEELWVWLAGRSGLNKRQMVALVSACGIQALYSMERSALEALGLQGQALESLCDKNVRQAQSVCNYCKAKGIQFLPYTDSRYPQRLRSLADPPILLYYKGILPDWNALPVIGVVGTRSATSYGQKATRIIAADLAKK